GFDEKGRFALLVKFNKKIYIEEKNTPALEIQMRKRQDSAWVVLISLNNSTLKGVFKTLIDDLVEETKHDSSRQLSQRKFIQRYKNWEKLFTEVQERQLSLLQIQGLIGELYLLKNYFIPKYGNESALTGWIGASSANKDFWYDDAWYEVKTKSKNQNIVHISNQSQLDSSKKNGYLVVNECEQTSSNLEKSINLYDLCHEIIAILVDEKLIIDFQKQLAKFEVIIDEKYQEPVFLIEETTFYQVDEKFPKIIAESSAVYNIKYDIYLPEIKAHIGEKIEWN
ncbi:MAG: PD-(D/E)XK motif protein, partial [Culicoidibacterales bacterium]